MSIDQHFSPEKSKMFESNPIYPPLARPAFSSKDPDKFDYERNLEPLYQDEIDPPFRDAKDELFDPPSCSGVVEWFNCLLFDVILLLLEAGVAIWLANSLFPHDLITEYRTILVVLAVPSLINPFLWLKIKSSKPAVGAYYTKFGTMFVFALLLLSFNSPFLVYLWHLYNAALGSRRDAANTKKLANTFRMVQAILTSVPLLLINMTTLVSLLETESGGDKVLDLKQLSNHLHEVEIHGFAYLISLINLIRAACLFNERLTFTVMFSIIALPFTVLTVFTRLLSISIITAFLEGQWVAVLFITLFFSNLLAYAVFRKRPRVLTKDSILQPIGASSTSSTSSSQHTSQTDEDLIESFDNCSDAGCQGCMSTNCKSKKDHNISHRSGKYNVQTGTFEKRTGMKRRPVKAVAKTSCWVDLPKSIAFSIGSIIVPIGYTNDVKQHHIGIKGGLFLIVNYFLHTILIGLALGYTIENNIPNTIQGVTISNPSIDVQIPSSKINIGAFGLGLGLSLPNQKMNLGSMPAMHASVDTENIDTILAVMLPLILAIFCLPFAMMRAAMMELDCFITHKKELDSLEEAGFAPRDGRNKRMAARKGDTLLETVFRNSESTPLKARMYCSLCCGLCGVFIFPMFSLVAMAFLFFSMH